MNQCIGAYYDSVDHAIVWWNYNSDGHHAIYMTDVKSEVTVPLVNNGDVLDLDPEHPISSCGIFYGDPTNGKVLYWINSQGQPSRVNIQKALSGDYGTYREQYLKLIKEPPSIPPQVVYEDNSTVTTNAVHKELFRFVYWFEYENFDQSVTSARSAVPLPIDPFDIDVDADPTKNADIAVVIQTGAPNVKKIHIGAQRNLGIVWSDIFEVDLLDKTELLIGDDDIYLYRFYNDKAYIDISVPFSLLEFDRVPRTANAMELLNGDTVAVAGILEGYNRLSSLGDSNAAGSSESNRRTQPKALLVAAQVGDTIGVTGQKLHIIVAGTVTTGDVFNVYTTNDTITFTTGSTQTTTAVINGLAASATGLGYNVVSSDANNLIIRKSGEQLIRYSQTPAAAVLGADDCTFVYDYWSKFAWAIVYFDKDGRTNGCMITEGFTVQTDGYTETSSVPNIPKITVTIYHQPPGFAHYFHLVRTQNLTKQRILDWISDRTFKDNVAGPDGHQYAYISIANLNQFIEDHSSSAFLAYDFAAGDRIRLYKLYPAGGISTPILYTDKDFEIQGQAINPIINGVQQQGQFLKIYLPTTYTLFDFDVQDVFGVNVSYDNYFMQIYRPAKPATEGLDKYYEYGARWAIGNPGEVNRFHQGMTQNQSTNYVTPAVFVFDQGDFYLRTRKINAGNELKYTMFPGDLDFSDNTRDILGAALTSQTYTTGEYNAQTSQIEFVTSDLAPSNNWFLQEVDGLARTFNIKGTLIFQAANFTSVGFGVFITSINGGTEHANTIFNSVAPLNANDFVEVVIDSQFTIPAGDNNTYITAYTSDAGFNLKIISGSFIITEAGKMFDQLCVDQNFSDTFQSAVNSNARPWIFDVNARETQNDTLFRYSLNYEANTNINDTNRFYPEKFNTYDARYGIVQRMIQDGNTLTVFQFRKCGADGVYSRWIKQQGGQNELITSTDIITPNNTFYYDGEFGVGNQQLSIAKNGYQYYFADPVKGYLLRLSKDGITAISDLYKAQSWAGDKLPPFLLNFPYQYGGFAKILGVFNFPKDRSGDYWATLQRGYAPQSLYGIYSIGGETLSFNEQANAFRSKYDIAPDFVLCAENKLYAWYGGLMYVFDNTDEYNKFFGVHYDSIVQVPAKDPQDVKKEFTTISYNAPYPQYGIDVKKWLAPNIGDVVTSLGLESNLVDEDFEYDQGFYHAAFQRAYNVRYGVVEGDELQGVHLQVRLSNSSTRFTWLAALYMNWLVGPKNY